MSALHFLPTKLAAPFRQSDYSWQLWCETTCLAVLSSPQ